MNENELLRQRYNNAGYASIAQLVRAINSSLSEQTWGRMLNKNEHIDTLTLLVMSAELGISTTVLRSLLLLRGEKLIADLLSPVYISVVETEFLIKFRAFNADPVKSKLIMDLMDHMQKPKERRAKPRSH